MPPARSPTPPGARRSKAGWEFVHVAIDDATRLAYAEVLTDEKASTAVGFLRRALRVLRRYGITVERVMTDNGSRLRLDHARDRLPRPRHPAPAHPAAAAANQRQGRALHPHHARRLGLRRDLQLTAENAPQPLTAGFGPTTIAADTQASGDKHPSPA